MRASLLWFLRWVDGKGGWVSAPLKLGDIALPVPVVLAPMAGITNVAFRRLAAEQGAGLYVCEMITSRGLVERQAKTLSMLAFDPLETTRSVQLYGVDPRYVGRRGAHPRRTSSASTTSTSTSAVRFPRSPARVGERLCRGSVTCCARS